MGLLEWEPVSKTFSLVREATASAFKDRCGCMDFLPALGMFVWGSSHLHLLNPLTQDTWRWLRDRDPETMFYTVGGSTGVIFPMAVFQLTGNEFLLCYNQGAIFVDATGTITRPRHCIEPWRRVPTSFAVMDDRLFMFSLHTVEIRDLRTGRNINRVQTIDQPGVSFVGRSPTSVFLCADMPDCSTIYELRRTSSSDDSLTSFAPHNSTSGKNFAAVRLQSWPSGHSTASGRPLSLAVFPSHPSLGARYLRPGMVATGKFAHAYTHTLAPLHASTCRGIVLSQLSSLELPTPIKHDLELVKSAFEFMDESRSVCKEWLLCVRHWCGCA